MDKGPVGRILHWTKLLYWHSSSGDNCALQKKVLKVELLNFLHKWLSFAQNFVVQKMGPKENAQSNHVARVVTCPGICWCRVGPI